MSRRADLFDRLPSLELRSLGETEKPSIRVDTSGEEISYASQGQQFTKSSKFRVIRAYLGGGSAAEKTQEQDIHQDLMEKWTQEHEFRHKGAIQGNDERVRSRRMGNQAFINHDGHSCNKFSQFHTIPGTHAIGSDPSPIAWAEGIKSLPLSQMRNGRHYRPVP
jgi:hypothetical protein